MFILLNMKLGLQNKVLGNSDRSPATNSTYKKLAVQWLNEALCFVSSFVVADSFRLRNRQLLVAANRSRTWPSPSTPHKTPRKAPKHRTSQRMATIHEQKLSPMPSAQSPYTCTVLSPNVQGHGLPAQHRTRPHSKPRNTAQANARPRSTNNS